jgi:hypothetical protein
MIRTSYKSGIGMLETLIGLSILVSAVLVLMATFNSYTSVALRETNVLKGIYLAEEGVEAIRTLRDKSFATNISAQTIGTPYHLIFVSPEWQLTTTPQIIDGKFQRTVTFDEVYRRDTDSDIIDVSSSDPKTMDPETKKVTVQVVWDDESRSIVTYITDLFDN